MLSYLLSLAELCPLIIAGRLLALWAKSYGKLGIAMVNEKQDGAGGFQS